jgi:hypothetical protein
MTGMTMDEIVEKLDFLRRFSPSFCGRDGLANYLLMGKVEIESAKSKLNKYDCEIDRQCTKYRLNPSICVADKCDVWSLRNLVVEYPEELKKIGKLGKRGTYKDLEYEEAKEERPTEKRRSILGIEPIF